MFLFHFQQPAYIPQEMCIRDSPITIPGIVFVTSAIPLIQVLSLLSIPVSYTHLDVYKRQGEPHYENEVLQLCIGSPMKENGEIVGYIVGSYKYDLLNDIISLLILGDTGSACILNEDGKIIADQNLQNIVNEISIYDLYTTDENAAVIKKALAFETGSSLMASNNRNYYIGYAPVPGTNWTLLVNSPQNEFMRGV